MANPPSSRPGRFGERTRLVQAGRDPSAQHGFVNTPIYRGSTVLYPTADDLLHRRGRYVYGTAGTPTTEALERAWTELTGAAGTVLTPSGLAAVSLALLSCLKSGDHLLMTDSAYRPTRVFCDTVLTAVRGGDDLLRPARRGGHRGALAAEHGGRLHRVAGLAILRDAGRAGDRRGGPCPRRRRPHGQYLGDALVLLRRTSAASTSRSRPAPNT